MRPPHEVRIAAEVLDFDPREHMDPKMARRMSRFIHFAMAAGKEAVADSGIDFAAMSQEQRDRVGVVVNTGGGGIEQVIDGTHVHDEKGPGSSRRSRSPRCRARWAQRMLSMEWGLTGPVITQVAACATSVIAFHDALRLIQTGECDVVVTGGTEAPIWPMGVAALANMTALSKRNDAPETASRPFDGTRDGFVLGEGAGVVIVESLAHARDRGATPIAEILGGALTADAFHISAPEPTGRGQARAMTNALRNSGVAPDEIDYIVAHGTATPLNDVTETRAIKAAYGDHAYKVAISSPKSMIGHLVGAAGIASALAGIGAIRDGIIPPTANLRTPDPECDLDYVPADGPQGEGRHGRGRRLRFRRPERRRHPAIRRRLARVPSPTGAAPGPRGRSSLRPPFALRGWRHPSR